jgi:hypothetical protein
MRPGCVRSTGTTRCRWRSSERRSPTTTASVPRTSSGPSSSGGSGGSPGLGNPPVDRRSAGNSSGRPSRDRGCGAELPCETASDRTRTLLGPDRSPQEVPRAVLRRLAAARRRLAHRGGGRPGGMVDRDRSGIGVDGSRRAAASPDGLRKMAADAAAGRPPSPPAALLEATPRRRVGRAARAGGAGASGAPVASPTTRGMSGRSRAGRARRSNGIGGAGRSRGR